jgi:hypothetical protein
MTCEQVVGYLLEGEGLDFLRESLSWVVQQLMEAEVSELVGAERGERTPERLTHRNGYRPRPWQTRAGEIELAIPKLRRGSYFPSFLEPRRRSERALVSVVQEAYVAGVSTRKVDQVVESLGLRISKSEVSRICQGLDEQVDAFRNRPLEGCYPYLWLDAKMEKVRDSGRVVRKCLVLAYAVHESGYREVIALDVGEAETEAFWRSFLRGLVERVWVPEISDPETANQRPGARTRADSREHEFVGRATQSLPGTHNRGRVAGLRVRQTCGYAASRYSWISPPSRSRRRTRSRSSTSPVGSPVDGSVLRGDHWPSARCGRCSL